MKNRALAISDLHVSVANTNVVRGISLLIQPGETHILMGPNGSGKSSLLYALMGHPQYTVTQGAVMLGDTNVLHLSTPERSKAGIFLGFQQPREVDGITVASFLRHAINAHKKEKGGDTIAPAVLAASLKDEMTAVGLDHTFMGRSVNEGFSGGEKKKAEIVQMALLSPAVALLDEIDSGLDIDAVRAIAARIQMLQERDNTAVLIVTHNPRLLEVLVPNYVHVMADGRIVESGGEALARDIEQNGYERFLTAQ